MAEDIQVIKTRFVVDTKQVKNASTDFKDLTNQIDKTDKSASDLDKAFTKIGVLAAGAFAVDRLISFGKEILDVTAKYQKYQAVLTNTLGSSEKAAKQLDVLAAFAEKTNFSVDELTSSYIKLVNQGFNPTTQELTKLADLANSTGKSFDQLTEAILDSQTGEFERLKEFGIKAAVAGDKVTFTFKGVKTQVDNTALSIKNYVLGLGELNGVQGSTEAISKTLGGQISNLGDAYEGFLKIIGNNLEPILSSSIEVLKSFIDFMAESAGGYELLTKKLKVTQGEQIKTALQAELAARMGIKTQEEANKLTDEQRKAALQSLIDSRLKEKQVLDQKWQDYQDFKIRLNQADRDRLQEQRFVINTEIEQLQTGLEPILQAEKANADKIAAEKKKAFELAKKQREKKLKELNQTEIDSLENIRKLQFDDAELTIKLDAETKDLQRKNNEEIRLKANEQRDKANEEEYAKMVERSEQILEYEGNLTQARANLQQNYLNTVSNIADLITTVFAGSAEAQVAALVLDKAVAVSQVIIQTQIGNGKIKAALGPLAPPYILANNIDMASSLALIAATTIPQITKANKKTESNKAQRFKDGVIDLQGPGTDTSDSIPSWLSKGESVMTAKETRQFKPLFNAIRRKELKPEHLNLKSNIIIKNDELVKEFKKRPVFETTFDERGITKKMIKEGIRQENINKRYTF